MSGTGVKDACGLPRECWEPQLEDPLQEQHVILSILSHLFRFLVLLFYVICMFICVCSCVWGIMYMCVHVYSYVCEGIMYMFICVCSCGGVSCAYKGHRTILSVPQECCKPSLSQVFSLAWISPIRFHWLASEPQRSVSLSLSGIEGKCPPPCSAGLHGL